MADDASYEAFLRRANQPTSGTSSVTETTASYADEPPIRKHPSLTLLNEKLASLSTKTFVTETDTDFAATFIPLSDLPSWSKSLNEFPSPQDLESEVDYGREGEILTVDEWDKRGSYETIVKAVKDIAKSDEVRVYTVKGRGGRFEVFILAKVHDGLLGVKAKGVAT